MKLEFSRQIFE